MNATIIVPSLQKLKENICMYLLYNIVNIEMNFQNY